MKFINLKDNINLKIDLLTSVENIYKVCCTC